MRLEAFFEKFELFADAPDALEKMRGLLIHFAVNGELVPNDPREKPVAQSLSGPSRDDAALPSNWRCGLVGDAFEFEYGENLPAPKRTETGEYPVYGSNGIVGTHDTYLTKEPAIIVGRKGSAGALNIATGPSWTTDVAYFVRPPSDLDLRFSYYLFSTLHLNELGKGIKPGLSRKEAYALPIALPPLAEQKRIVAKVDELMALCDRLESQQVERESRHTALVRASIARFAEAATPANLQFLFHHSYTIPPADLRKSILSLAIQGKLVPQDPRDVPACETFPEIKRARCSEGQATVPSAWTVSSYRDITSLVTSGSRGWKEFYAKSGAIFIRTQNIKTDRLVLDDVAFVKLPGSIDAKRALVMKDDIMITVTGANVTKSARVEAHLPEAYVSQHIALTRPKWPTMSRWLHLCFISPAGARGKLESLAYGDKPGLNLDNIRDLRFPIPPLAEQRRIVAKVDQLMALIDQLETQLAASRSTAANLLEALVAELTTQKGVGNET
jgi:type I restriction enzyme S subunit